MEDKKMDIVVCIKRVPMTQEVDLEIDKHEKAIRTEGLAYVINDWDNYAVEEAVLLKEKLGGSVTAINVGGEDDEEVLRRALAMGADRAIRIDAGPLEPDSFVLSKLLAAVIKDLQYDLVLTGVQAEDDNCGTVGVMLAEHLDIPHAAVVTFIDPKEKDAVVRIELEGGMDELLSIQLPALMSIQTGINEPRYVSIMGIRKANKKALDVIDATELGLSDDDLTNRIMVEEVFLPPETEGAEMIEGDPSMIADSILGILTQKGVSI
jgi:electron transfer flavoprotein beta subunit